MILITLPGEPISTQHIYGHSGGRKYLTRKASDRKGEYQWEAKSQYKGEPLEGKLSISVIVYFGTKRGEGSDWDNFHKLSMDALNGIVWEDDCQIREAQVLLEYDKKKPRIEIRVI